MNIIETDLPGCIVVEPRVFADDRGVFFETFNASRAAEFPFAMNFLQGNVSVSKSGTLRGLHLQSPHAQGKLVSVLRGAAWDVAVDVRVGSPTFGRWTAVVLNAESHRQFWIPRGFAHGFVALEDDTVFSYFCDETYHPESEIGIHPLDPALEINWPIKEVLLSPKDGKSPNLADIAPGKLPQYDGDGG